MITTAKKKYVDPNLTKIEGALNDIKMKYKNTEGEAEINEALSGLYDAKSKMFRLRSTLNVLAEKTSDKVDDVLSAIEKFSKHSEGRMKDIFFEKIVTRMSRMLSESEIDLKDSLYDYDEAEKSLNIVHNQVNNYKSELQSFINNDNGKLQKWINKLRTEAYGASALCLAIWFSCPFVYAATAAGVEGSIKSARKELEKQREGAKVSMKAVEGVIKEVNNGHQFIYEQQPLIKTWSKEVGTVKDELKNVTGVIYLVNHDETEDMKNILNNLKEACKDYLKHSEDSL